MATATLSSAPGICSKHVLLNWSHVTVGGTAVPFLFRFMCWLTGRVALHGGARALGQWADLSMAGAAAVGRTATLTVSVGIIRC